MRANRIKPRNDRMLTLKEERFVEEYVRTRNAKQSAKFAGYANAGDLTKRPRIANEIERRVRKAMAKKQIDADRVVAELGKIAFANIDDFVDDEYRIGGKPSRRKMAAVESVTTETIIDRRRDIEPEDREDIKRVRLKMYNKLDALGQLGRYFGLFKDKVEVSHELGARLDRAFERLQKEGAEPDAS